MNLSVRYKTLILIGATIIIALGGYAVLMRNMGAMEGRYIEKTRAAVEQLIATETEKINTYMTIIHDGAAGIAVAGETLWMVRGWGDSEAREAVTDYLMRNIARYPNAVGCGLWYEPGVFTAEEAYFGPYARWDDGKVVLTMEYSNADYDYHAQDWYTQAIPVQWDRNKERSESVYWSEPYLDETSDTLMLTVGSVMYGAQRRIIGMSTLDVSIEDLRKVVVGINITPTATAFAVDTRSGLLAAYPSNNALLLQPVAKLPFTESGRRLASVAPGGQTQFTTEVNGEPVTVFYHVALSGIGLGIAVPDSELYIEATRLAKVNWNTTLVVAGVLFFLLVVILLAFNRIVIGPLLSLTAFSRSVADGRLDTPIADDYKSEFAILRNAMAAMLDTMKEKMREAESRTEEARLNALNAEAAQQVAEEATRNAQKARSEGMRQAAESLRSAVAVIGMAAEELSHKVNASNQGAEAQSERVSATAGAMEELSGAVQDISSNADSAANFSNESHAAAEQGVVQAAGILNNMGSAHKDFKSAYEGMLDLSNKANGIGAIAQTIADIADQTNLLALNAAIEAARAGDAGRGFAVVADEVRKLAEKTMSATKEVGASITAIQKATGGTLSSMDRTAGLLEQAMGDVQAAESMLRNISSLVTSSADQILAIAVASKQQSAATGNVNASIVEINRISGETAAAMQDASRAVDELGRQTATLKNLIDILEKE